jgi:hypothetical protein
VSFTLYDASIPIYLRMLGNLDALLDKAVAHAQAKGVALSTLTEARLIPDMAPFTAQVQMASDAAKGGAARLAQLTPPSFPDVETTIPELKERIAKTIAFVSSVKREQVDGGEDRVIELKFPNGSMSFTGAEFVTSFSVPNFLFHVTTAYALLRAAGVPLGKMDFLAGNEVPAAA